MVTLWFNYAKRDYGEKMTKSISDIRKDIINADKKFTGVSDVFNVINDHANSRKEPLISGDKFHLYINSVPVAQPRPRAVVAPYKTTSGKSIVRMYEAPAVHPIYNFKYSVREKFREHYTGAPTKLPIKMVILFVMPRPNRLIWKAKEMPREPHLSKPDIDNLSKSVLDSLEKLLYLNDSCVYNLKAEKIIAGGEEAGHCEIYIEVC